MFSNMTDIDEESIILKIYEIFQLNSNLTRFYFRCFFLSTGGGRRGLVFGSASVFLPILHVHYTFIFFLANCKVALYSH